MLKTATPLLFAFILLFSACDEGIVPPPVVPNDDVAGKQELINWLEDGTEIMRRINRNGPMSARIFAYTSVAYYQGFAIGNPDMPSLAGKLHGLDSLPTGDVGVSYNYGLVSSAAAFKVLSKAFQNDGDNNLVQLSSTFNTQINSYLQYGVSQSLIDRSVELGFDIGNGVIHWMDNDNFNAGIDGLFSGGTGAEIWRPTPPSNFAGLLPNWYLVRPFTYTFDELFGICPPDAPTPFSLTDGSEYMNAINEVKDLSSNASVDQLNMANYWADGTDSYTISGHYVRLLMQFLRSSEVDGKEAATAFAQLSIALADIHITAWQLKYDIQRIRPVSVIRMTSDPNWLSPIPAIAAPEFPSERAACAQAAANIFAFNFGDMAFVDSTYQSSGFGVRSFDNFTKMADEAALAQVYAGTELRATTEKSRYTGTCMADRVRSVFE